MRLPWGLYLFQPAQPLPPCLIGLPPRWSALLFLLAPYSWFRNAEGEREELHGGSAPAQPVQGLLAQFNHGLGLRRSRQQPAEPGPDLADPGPTRFRRRLRRGLRVQ